MDIDDVVWVDPARMGGTPCFTGTRVPVRSLFEALEHGRSLPEFLDHFPGVTKDQLVAALYLGGEAIIAEALSRAREHHPDLVPVR